MTETGTPASPCRSTVSICKTHDLPERYRCTLETLSLCRICAKEHVCDVNPIPVLLPTKHAKHLVDDVQQINQSRPSTVDVADANVSLSNLNLKGNPEPPPRTNSSGSNGALEKEKPSVSPNGSVRSKSSPAPPCPIHNLPQKFRCTLESLPLCFECSKTHICAPTYRGIDNLTQEARQYQSLTLPRVPSIDTGSEGSGVSADSGSPRCVGKSSPSLPRTSRMSAKALFHTDESL
jgi:hypothetical protein